MDSKTINLTLPAKLLEELNEAAKANYASRSDYIRESVVARLKREQSLAAPVVSSTPEIDEDEALLKKYGII